MMSPRILRDGVSKNGVSPARDEVQVDIAFVLTRQYAYFKFEILTGYFTLMRSQFSILH